MSYGHAMQTGLNGTIVVAGPLSLDPQDTRYKASSQGLKGGSAVETSAPTADMERKTGPAMS